MPELPEVETTLRGIQPFVEKHTIQQLVIRQTHLRWPVPQAKLQHVIGHTVTSVTRRGKYLLLTTPVGTLILHLGMSGRLRLLDTSVKPNKHDHIDILFSNHYRLRFTDPRRFGALLWAEAGDPLGHPLLYPLGVEPLTRDFTARYLQQQLQNKRLAIKAALMDQHIVVGIGNIYSTEALFFAGIHPITPAKMLTLAQLKRLVTATKTILRQAIQQGGTTLKDFLNSEGKPGYFSQTLKVYGRADLPCLRCQSPLQRIRLGQRSTVYCTCCQC